MWDSLAIQGAVAGVVALALAVMALSLRPGELEYLISAIRSVLPIAVIPVIWIEFQVFPVEIIAHPIWASTASALGHSVRSTISVDPGASIISLGQYITLAGDALLVASATVDRRRAEIVLFTMTGATTIIALIVLSHSRLLPMLSFSPDLNAKAMVCVVLGGILACAAAIRTVERYETRYSNPQRSIPLLMLSFTYCVAAFTLCLAVLLQQTSQTMTVVLLCSSTPLVCISIIRRFGLRIWGITAITVSFMGAAVLLIVSQPFARDKSPLLLFAISSQESQKALSQRVLEGAPALGTGAGTFAAIAPSYRQMGDPPTGPVASTTAANFAIELGRPMLGLILVSVIGSIAVLFKSALQRGRDSFFPALGASALVALALLGFANAGLSGTAPGLLAAGVFGLAIAQRKSRTTRLQ